MAYGKDITKWPAERRKVEMDEEDFEEPPELDRFDERK
jgi:hypothetical protein